MRELVKCICGSHSNELPIYLDTLPTREIVSTSTIISFCKGCGKKMILTDLQKLKLLDDTIRLIKRSDYYALDLF